MASCSQPPPPPAITKIRSQPSDMELAMMLRAHVDPSASPPAAGNTITIHDADVYAQDPTDLTRHLAATVAEDGQEAWYFCTKLEPKSQRRGKRKRRCMESGVWHDEGKSKPVVVGSEGGAIGHRSLFSFFSKVDGKKERTGWIMHEFQLFVPDGNEESPVVLCKVFRSSRWCAPDPAISAAAAAAAQAQAEVEALAEREAIVEAVRVALAARRDAVSERNLQERQSNLAAREAAVEAREAEGEALARRDTADLAVSERNLQERQSNLTAREAAVEAREAALQTREAEGEALATRDADVNQPLDLNSPFALVMEWAAMLREARELARVAWEPRFAMLRDTESREEFEWWLAELERELEVRAAEGAGLARRDAARLAVSERNLQERERNLAAREAAFDSRLQTLQEELKAELEALVLMMAAILMAATLVTRAGLLMLLPIAGGSRAIAVEH